MFMPVHKGGVGVQKVQNPVHVVCERPLMGRRVCIVKIPMNSSSADLSLREHFIWTKKIFFNWKKNVEPTANNHISFLKNKEHVFSKQV